MISGIKSSGTRAYRSIMKNSRSEQINPNDNRGSTPRRKRQTSKHSDQDAPIAKKHFMYTVCLQG